MSIEIHPNKDKAAPFQIFLNLEDESYIQQASDLADLFENDVDAYGQFDLTKALETAKSQPHLAIIATNKTTLKKSYSTLSALTSSITNALESEGTVGLTDNEQFHKVLAHAFCSLECQEGKPWFQISANPSTDGGPTTYTYNFFIVSQGANTGPMMAAGPLVLRVTANDTIDEVLGQHNDRKHSRVSLKAQEITIEISGFQVVTPLS